MVWRAPARETQKMSVCAFSHNRRRKTRKTHLRGIGGHPRCFEFEREKRVTCITAISVISATPPPLPNSSRSSKTRYARDTVTFFKFCIRRTDTHMHT